MSTNIRPEISKKNKWWIPKHRYYELKHFCLQYPEWKELVRESVWWNKTYLGGSVEYSDPVARSADERERLLANIAMVEKAAKDASDELWRYILKAVTEGLSYVNLRMVYEMPCSKDMYYDRYRRFFWLLARSQ